MIWFLLFIVFVVGVFVYKPQNPIYKAYSKNGLILIKKLEELFDNQGSIAPYSNLDLYKEIFGERPQSYDDFLEKAGLSGIDEDDEKSNKSKALDYMDHLTHSLGVRYSSSFRKLKSIDSLEAYKEYGINLKANEVIHDVINNVDWFEEKTIATSIRYSGLQYKMGTNMSFRSGSLNLSKKIISSFVPIARGSIYITNTRIIFIAPKEAVNKSISIEDILEFSLFKDGVLLGIPNRKKPLIVFSEYIDTIKRRDHLTRFLLVIDRIIMGNQNEDIK